MSVISDFANLALTEERAYDRNVWVAEISKNREGLNEVQTRYLDSYNSLTAAEQIDFLTDLSK